MDLSSLWEAIYHLRYVLAFVGVMFFFAAGMAKVMGE